MTRPRRGRTAPPDVDDLLAAVCSAPPGAPIPPRLLALLEGRPPGRVAARLERRLDVGLDHLWRSGWRPGEVIRQVRRAGSKRAATLARTAIAVDHARRDPGTVHPRWQAHLDGLDLPPVTPDGPGTRPGWLAGPELAHWMGRDGAWPVVLTAAAETVRVVAQLGPLEVLIPPPGAPSGTASMVDLAGEEASPVLAKVRQLLAQAESTPYAAEAETFTAKAQELMARHSIDEALVWARADGSGRPISVRLPIDDPYAKAKVSLLAVVSAASRCQTVSLEPYGLATVVGFRSDVFFCETLYTSLLVQAQRELEQVGAAAGAGDRRRSRGYRSSFLHAYAQRIGVRLDEVNRRIEDEVGRDIGDAAGPGVGPGGQLLPVLAERSQAVQQAVVERFPHLTRSRATMVTDRHGWLAGQAAADRAELNPTRLGSSPDGSTPRALP
ncbi:MAG: DUF2786 domain-containing protein [Acidimicrobiales bacterium]